MLIGIPKEIKVEEYRVGLTPDSVRQYVSHGHKVLIQKNVQMRAVFAMSSALWP